MKILGGSYLIIAELPAQWLRTASEKPTTEEAAAYPVWLMDSLGIRAAIFLRCPACNKPMNLFPSSKEEQREWNDTAPDVTTMAGCENCGAVYLLTNDTAYILTILPPQKKVSTLPRPWVAGGGVSM